MKKLLLIFLICYYGFINAQNSKGGIIIYNFKPEEHKSNNIKNKILTNRLNKSINLASKNVNFKLKFNHDASIFWREKIMSQDNNNKLGLHFLNFGNFYTNVRDNIKIKRVDFMNELFLVTSNFNDIHWVLTNETKQINGIKCFKANFIKTINNKYKTKQNIIAWYAPSLPFQFGPAGFCNLPGLIIELKIEKRGTFIANKIIFLNEKPIIKAFKNGKMITTKEFNKITIKSYNKMTNGF